MRQSSSVLLSNGLRVSLVDVDGLWGCLYTTGEHVPSWEERGKHYMREVSEVLSRLILEWEPELVKVAFYYPPPSHGELINVFFNSVKTYLSGSKCWPWCYGERAYVASDSMAIRQLRRRRGWKVTGKVLPPHLGSVGSFCDSNRRASTVWNMLEASMDSDKEWGTIVQCAQWKKQANERQGKGLSLFKRTL